MSAVSSVSVSVAGVTSPVLQTGDPAATEAVVFVHGNPGPSSDWLDLLSRTGDFARGVAPDMPGFGNADKPADFNYSVDGYAEHLSGVIEQLGITRVHLVLHDFGGAFGLFWALAHPDRVASVTLINTGVLLDYDWHILARLWRTPLLGEFLMGTTTRGAFVGLLARDNPRLLRVDLNRLYDVSAPWRIRRATLKLYRATPASAFTSLRGPLRTLDLPALVVWGMTDAYIPWQQAERQRESFPSAQVELLDGLGHWPFLEDPARVAELVIPFLKSQLGSAR